MTELALQAVAERRSQIYWFLSRLFIDRPEAGFLNELAGALGGTHADGGSEPMRTAMASMSASLPPARDAAVEALGVEYTRLLRGINANTSLPPPYESLHFGGRESAEATVRVLSEMAAAGFGDVVPEVGPQDHVGAELRFLSLLCYRESQAWSSADLDAAESALTRQQAFLDDHVLRWVPGYCARMAKESREPFYRAVAELTTVALREDHERVRELHAECASFRAAEAGRMTEPLAAGD